jgi:hypothetical protein
VDCGTARRPSKAIVVFVLAQGLKGVIVVLHAQRVKQRATHLLSARKLACWTNGLSQSENLFEFRRISRAFKMALLCNKSAIASENTISFVADPGNAPLRPPSRPKSEAAYPQHQPQQRPRFRP